MLGIRRYLVGMALGLVTIQAMLFVVPVSGGCASSACTCCKPGSGETCPMCRRVKDAPGECRCSMSSHHRDAELAWLLGVPTMLPESTTTSVQRVPMGEVTAVTAMPTWFSSAPPSPPPRA